MLEFKIDIGTTVTYNKRLLTRDDSRDTKSVATHVIQNQSSILWFTNDIIKNKRVLAVSA